VLEITIAEQFVVEVAATEGWIDKRAARGPDFGDFNDGSYLWPAVPLAHRGD